jgi:hypothetical protein
MNKYFHCLIPLVLFLCFTCSQQQPADTLAAEVSYIKKWAPDDTRNLPKLGVERGLSLKAPNATPGYVLLHPTQGTGTYLLNLDGAIVHIWNGELFTMNSYLQDDGRIIRLERDPDFPVFDGGGQSGRIREYSWDGELLWDFEYATEAYLTHHDFEVMPNGNILAIAWEARSKKDAVAAGRNPDLTPEAGIWPDKIIEREPQRPEGGRIVWEWHLWDHLVQEFDPAKANYGKISEHPRKVDINAHAHVPEITAEQVEQMKKGGMMTSNATVENQGSDITHVNSVSYNPELDQIVISSPHYHEIWIVDHSTTTEEARGSTGGEYGHGGDLLYRWGCDANYGHGTPQEQILFGQHDTRWIPQGYPGEGNLMVFNNDVYHPNSKFPNAFAAFGAKNSPEISVADLANYSAVLELEPPIGQNGEYMLTDEGVFGSGELVWRYTAPDTLSFYSPFVSGAHRMKNGHTFITEGATGRLFEVTPTGEMVWEYLNPYNDQYLLPDGSPPQPAGPFMYMQFRGTHIPADHPALAGKSLEALDSQPGIFTPPPPPAQAP